MTPQTADEAAYSDAQMDGFADQIKNDLPDLWDNPGKRHSLVFVIVEFVLATLVGRQTLSTSAVTSPIGWIGLPSRHGSRRSGQSAAFA